MSPSRNPFTPAFGTLPPVMAGRDEYVGLMADAFDNGLGDPNLSTIFIGARGTGKTALMTRVCDEALAHGWVSASTTAIPGMLDDLYEASERAVESLTGRAPSARMVSLGLGPVTAEWEHHAVVTGNWRTRMTRLLDRLEPYGTGLLICVDEVRVDVSEMVTLAATYQLLIRERRKVALVMAGLPYHVGKLVEDESVSFLRRSQQHWLGRISDVDVASALRRTVEEAGKTIGHDALDACVNAIDGFAYMFQLVGYRSWLESRDERAISLLAVERGIEAARQELDDRILAATWRELSNGDVRFLEAMLPDAGESRLAAISKRMGVTSNYATKYKSRLLKQGVIAERGRGVVAFELPGFRDFVARKKNWATGG